jgi:hypothetical protein
VIIYGSLVTLSRVLLMVLYKHWLTSILTVSICVLVFALLMAIFSTGSPEAVLASVAAYAAVLMVFVGTGTGGYLVYN